MKKRALWTSIAVWMPLIVVAQTEAKAGRIEALQIGLQPTQVAALVGIGLIGMLIAKEFTPKRRQRVAVR